MSITKKERDRANAKKRYQAKRAAGECPWGGCAEKAEPGHVMCAKHRRTVNERTPKYRQTAVMETDYVDSN